MLKFQNYFKKKKYILIFLITIFLIGSIVGILLSITNMDILREDLNYYITNIYHLSYNYTLIHFFLLVLSFVLSFIGIGVPLLCTIFFYEGLSLGFLIGLFSYTYFFKGFLYAIIFFLITKGLYLIILAVFFFKCLEIARKMIGKYIYKNDPSLVIVRLIKACGILIVLLLFIDICVLFLVDKILPVFYFLLT